MREIINENESGYPPLTFLFFLQKEKEHLKINATFYDMSYKSITPFWESICPVDRCEYYFWQISIAI